MDWIEVLIRLSLAVGLGAVVGLERELRGQPAGLRTHAVVALGAALFTVAGAYGFTDVGDTSNPGRIAAQVASGIGFLGAGVIMRHGLDVKGLTTAATLWLAGALGVATGAGMGVGAVIATVLVVVVLLSDVLTRRFIDQRLHSLVEVRYQVGHGALGHIVQLMEERSRFLNIMEVVEHGDTDPMERTVSLEVEVPADELDALIASVRDRAGVLEVAIDRDRGATR